MLQGSKQIKSTKKEEMVGGSGTLAFPQRHHGFPFGSGFAPRLGGGALACQLRAYYKGQ